jgi:hypothetical protein
MSNVKPYSQHSVVKHAENLAQVVISQELQSLEDSLKKSSMERIYEETGKRCDKATFDKEYEIAKKNVMEQRKNEARDFAKSLFGFK